MLKQPTCRWTPGLLLVMPALVVGLAACESVVWQRPGTEQATMHDDLRACRWEARLRAQYRLSYDPQLMPRGSAAPMGCPGTFTTGGSAFRDPSCPLGTPYAPQYAGTSVAGTQAFLESDFTDECMQDKGYTIAPVPPDK